MMRGFVIAIALAAIIIAIILATQRTNRGAPQPSVAVAPPARTNLTSFREVTKLGDVLIDANDPEFAQRVIPNIQKFFATLDSIGVNPLKDEPLMFTKIRKAALSEDGIMCRFIINNDWTATYFDTVHFSDIMHFGQHGPDDPFSAISHANTNALIRLSENAIKMPQPEAERIIEQIEQTLAVDRSQFDKPKVYPEKLFDYDLGIHTVRYHKKGTDPLNGLNYTVSFSIKATSPKTAVLVRYLNSRR